MLSAALLAVSCNGLLENNERDLIEGTGGSGSDSGGTNSTTGSSGEAGLAGMSLDSGGAAGAGDGGKAGEAGESTGTDGVGNVGGVGGIGGVGGASASSATGTSTVTGEPCECTPGVPEPTQVACGNCGTATVERNCNESCQWDAYGEPGACMNEGTCTPSKPLEKIGHCDAGGYRYDTGTCGADCQPGPWTRGECIPPENECVGCGCPGYCEHPERGGATCLWIACSEKDARAECDTDISNRCGVSSYEFIEWLPD